MCVIDTCMNRQLGISEQLLPTSSSLGSKFLQLAHTPGACASIY